MITLDLMISRCTPEVGPPCQGLPLYPLFPSKVRPDPLSLTPLGDTPRALCLGRAPKGGGPRTLGASREERVIEGEGRANGVRGPPRGRKEVKGVKLVFPRGLRGPLIRSSIVGA